MKKEDQSQKLNVLTYNYKHQHREISLKYIKKNVITNAQIISHSFVNPALIRNIFKGLVSRAKHLRSKKYLEEELNFLTDTFVEKGRN